MSLLLPVLHPILPDAVQRMVRHFQNIPLDSWFRENEPPMSQLQFEVSPEVLAYLRAHRGALYTTSEHMYSVRATDVVTLHKDVLKFASRYPYELEFVQALSDGEGIAGASPWGKQQMMVLQTELRGSSTTDSGHEYDMAVLVAKLAAAKGKRDVVTDVLLAAREACRGARAKAMDLNTRVRRRKIYNLHWK